MTVDSTAIGETGITGIMGEEGGVASAWWTMVKGQRLDKHRAAQMKNRTSGREDGGPCVCHFHCEQMPVGWSLTCDKRAVRSANHRETLCDWQITWVFCFLDNNDVNLPICCSEKIKLTLWTGSVCLFAYVCVSVWNPWYSLSQVNVLFVITEKQHIFVQSALSLRFRDKSQDISVYYLIVTWSCTANLRYFRQTEL